MARSKTVSDEEILFQAMAVMRARGATNFTLSEVASNVGLSRTAINLRFESAQALKLKLVHILVDQFSDWLDKLPRSRSGNGLLDFAGQLGSIVTSREALLSVLDRYSDTMKDPKLAALEAKRAAILLAAIGARMPPTSISRPAAVKAFSAHLVGTLLGWDGKGNARAHLISRTKDWLRLANIPFDNDSLALSEPIPHLVLGRVRTSQ